MNIDKIIKFIDDSIDQLTDRQKRAIFVIGLNVFFDIMTGDAEIVFAGTLVGLIYLFVASIGGKK